MNWRSKSLAFRVLSAIPFGSELHYTAQRHLTRTLPRKPAALDSLWNKAEAVLKQFGQHCSRRYQESVFLEIGAGRDLAVPLALRLMGVGKVIAIDISQLAKIDLVAQAAVHLAKRAAVEAPQIRDWSDLARFGVQYIAPATAAGITEPIDCVCSNEVLEHIDPDGLRALAIETRRSLRSGGIAIHEIDFSDHYARSDVAIDRFNFLRFDDRDWRKHNSHFQYVNRLRPSDYEAIFTGASWTVLEDVINEGGRRTTTRQAIAPCFQSYSDRDLFALSGTLVLGG